VVKRKRDGPKDSCKESDMGIDDPFSPLSIYHIIRLCTKLSKKFKESYQIRRNKTMILNGTPFVGKGLSFLYLSFRQDNINLT